MQKIFRKRAVRDLKSNFFRYLALGFLIAFGMYIVISLVGAADTVIGDVNSAAERNHVEDGEFNVFIPLTKNQENDLKDKGVTIEKMFYLDYLLKDNSTIRVFKNRKNINMIDLDKGRLPKDSNEAVIERRYSEEHNLSVGKSIKIDGSKFKIVGIGTVPDYDAMFKNMSDTSVESKTFGLAFVTDSQYEKLKQNGGYSKTEEYSYSYKLNGKMTYNGLKDYLKKLDFNAEDVADPYFKEFWNETAGKKKDMQKGIGELSDGALKLQNALSVLNKNSTDINKGADEIFKAYLNETFDKLKEYGCTQELNEENYESVLQSYIKSAASVELKTSLSAVLSELNSIRDYKNGIASYTDGVSKSLSGAGNLADGTNSLKKNTDEFLNKYFKTDINDLTQFVKTADNRRIKASSGDVAINKYAGLAAGIIIMILFTYVISVFIIHGIEKESSVIGTLYALGVKKKELITHYLTLPVAVTLIFGIIGTVLGFSSYGVNVQMQSDYTYYSVPELKVMHPLYLIIYAVFMPPLVAALVNYLVISKKLSQPALKMIRNEQKKSRISNINLGNIGFVRRFQIRQMLRESRTGVTVIFGMFISLLIMMLGIDSYVMCNNISVKNKADTKYQYMYTYKYPTAKTPEEGTACYMQTLSKESLGYDMDVTVLGTGKNNPYFNFNTVKGKNKIVVASSTAEKFNLKVGDKLTLEDRENNMDYAFTVERIVPYSVGLYAFMDIGSMRELFNKQNDYYNVVFSSKKLDIEAGRLYSVTTKKDIAKSSDVFINEMIPMFVMLIIVSSVIFCIVMYLMMKVMIDRSSFSISLIKIFGYRTREIRKLYLDGNFYIISVGAAVSIFLSKKLMDKIYPYLTSNIACGADTAFSWKIYIGIFIGIIILYSVINKLLTRRLNSITPAEVLKNRE